MLAPRKSKENEIVVCYSFVENTSVFAYVWNFRFLPEELRPCRDRQAGSLAAFNQPGHATMQHLDEGICERETVISFVGEKTRPLIPPVAEIHRTEGVSSRGAYYLFFNPERDLNEVN